MKTYAEYARLCEEKLVPLFPADYQPLIEQELMAQKKHTKREKVAQKSVFSFFKKTSSRPVFKPYGYIRTLVYHGHRYSSMMPYSALYQAAGINDYTLLQQGIRQSARLSALFHCSYAGGNDHGSLFHDVISALAAGDRQLVSLCLPQSAGPSANIAANLFLGLWYQDPDLFQQARQKAETWLSSKRPIILAAQLRYLLALGTKDPLAASTELGELCRGIPYEKEYYVQIAPPEFGRCMIPFIHGLIMLAVYLNGKTFAAEMSLPQDYIWQPYLDFMTEQTELASDKLYISFTGELELINLLINQMPAVRLCPGLKPTRKQTDDRAYIQALQDLFTATVDLETYFYRYN